MQLKITSNNSQLHNSRFELSFYYVALNCSRDAKNAYFALEVLDIFVRMKKLGILLPLYIILLACMPCADIDECTANADSFITTFDSHHKDKGAEACSPFCACNCCGQRASQQKSVSVINVIFPCPILKQTPVQSFSLQSVLHKIWQPPQLV